MRTLFLGLGLAAGLVAGGVALFFRTEDPIVLWMGVGLGIVVGVASLAFGLGLPRS